MLKCILSLGAAAAISLNGGVIRWHNTPDCRDKNFWHQLKSHPKYETLMKRADEAVAAELVSPLPWYLEFTRTGVRDNYERRHNQLRKFGPLVVAYCTTGDKKYLKNIEERIKIILSLPTWVISAHDRELKAYKQQEVLIDLFSTKFGSELAATLYILEPVLDKQLAARVRQAVFHHIIDPIEEVISGKCPPSRFWWLNGTNNWNTICKRGIIAASLSIGMEKERIDKIIRLFFDNFENYMASFGSDGFCDEGMSYWGGSCGSYLIIAALLKQYDNRDVFLNSPRMLKAVMYPENIMMAPGFFPAYNDCRIDAQPPLYTLQLRDILLGKRKGFSTDIEFGDHISDICLQLFYPVDNTPCVVTNPEPFSMFAEAGCFVVRETAASPLSVSFKATHNRESHNHNDVGNYVIAVKGVPLVIDPGRGGYTRETFSAGRYNSKLLNSYGHSVPRINGKLQTNREGGDAFNPPKNLTPVEKIRAVRLKHEFSPDHAMAKFDISRVYNHVPEVKKLERTFVFDRKNNGSFTVTDEAVFTKAAEFEGAVITMSDIKELGGNKYLITWQGKTSPDFFPDRFENAGRPSLLLEVKCNVPYKFSIDTINERSRYAMPVYRMAFTAEKADAVKMEFIYTPVKK